MEWTSVNDGLPADCVNVLTCDSSGNMHIMYHHKLFKEPFNISCGNDRFFPVKWWQPLPEPPKEES